MFKSIRPAAAAVVFAALCSFSASAQATRTWVSGVGDDANPCSRTAPCKTFAGAISKTASGGVIDALDPGGFGAVTITKPITIEGNGTLASILHSGTNGVVINITTGTNRNVILRNILIDGTGATLGLNGIRFLAGDSLLVEDCHIKSVSNVGIDFEPNSTAAQLTVRNTSIQLGTVGGILVKPQVGGSARGMIYNTTLSRNGYGVRVEDNANVTFQRSVASNNTGNGLWAFSNGGGLLFTVDQSLTTQNAQAGLQTNGGNAAMRVNDTTISGNQGTGVNVVGGELSSWGNNRVTGNGAPGAFNGALLTFN